MKKRIIPILIVLTVLIGLTGLFATPSKAATGNLMAGYCKVTIDPYQYTNENGEVEPIEDLPMGGYGAVTERLSSGRMDDTGDGEITDDDGLFATCTAITDQYGTTIIHFGVDNTNSTTWTSDARTAIVEALKEEGYTVIKSNIFFTASHSHSTPQLTFSNSNYPELTEKVNLYKEWVYEQLVAAAVAAMKDQVPVTMTKGTFDASDAIGSMNPSATDAQKKMNTVRHYTSTVNGETVVGGSNFGATSSTNIKEVSEPNDTMYLVQFTPVDTSSGKDPILWVNWSAHATINSTGGSGGASTSTYSGIHYTDISSDYINSLRYSLENNICYSDTINTNYYSKVDSTQTYRVSFISGAAGNLIPSGTRINCQDPDVEPAATSEENPGANAEGRLYGQKLAAIARYGLSTAMSSTLDTSSIRVVTKNFEFDRQEPAKEVYDLIVAMRQVTVTLDDGTTKNLVAYLTTNSTTWSERSNYYEDFPTLKKFTSRYQLSNLSQIVTDYDAGKTTGSTYVSVIALGTELSILVNPCELADRYSSNATLSDTSDNDWDKLISSSTYGTPMIMGYTHYSGSAGYIPNNLAYNYNSGADGDGADVSDNYITGSYESSNADFAAGTGEKLIDFYANMLQVANTTSGRVQCECGGKAAGMTDHECSNVEFLPWTDATSLPSSGNYYLTTNVTISGQRSVSPTLRLDLNGYSITHQVTAEQGALAEAEKTHDTRVFSVSAGSYLSITDSTDTPGTITRDLSNLTDTQKSAIGNYGLLAIIYSDAHTVIYNGVFDSTGATTKGGSCISNNYAGSNLTIYGGTFNGGSVSSNGGSIYNAGTLNVYGGTFNGGTATGKGGILFNSGTANISGGNFTGGQSDSGGAIYNSGTATILGGVISGNRTRNNGNCPGIYCGTNAKLTVGGTAEIYGNTKYKDDGTTAMNVNINIRFVTETDMATNFTVSGDFTGKAGVFIDTRSNGLDIGVSDSASFTAENLALDYYSDYDIAVSEDDIILATVITQCECGGTAKGKPGHTCEEIEFLPWTDAENLPSSGNYYLTTDVTTTVQKGLSGTLRLDLNGYSITHQVTAEQGALAEAEKTHNTRVFSVSSGSYLSITDSTDTPGTITRDLSNLTDTQKSAIGNYGLILLINGSASATLYNGTLDATGMYAGGGGCISLQNTACSFKMYGGSLLGGISNSGGVMYNCGNAEFYGGTVTGGVTKTSGGACGGIYVAVYNEVCGDLTIGGDVEIYDNKKSNGNQTNIRFSKVENMATHFTVTGEFTGKASFYPASRTEGQVIGISDNASFGSDNLYLDIYTDGAYDIARSGENIILTAPKSQCECGGKAEGKYGHTCETLTWHPWNKSSSFPTETGNYYLTGTVTTTKRAELPGEATVRIDLKGHDIIRSVTTTTITSSIFGMTDTASTYLSITDSTSDVGTVTRDLSTLDADTKASIRNYGLLMFVQNITGGGMTIYDGIYDMDGAYCDSASVIFNSSSNSTLNIYGGEILCGITPTSKHGAIYSSGPVGLYGGKITGGQAVSTSTAAVRMAQNSNLLTISGDVEVTGNSRITIADDGTITEVAAANIFVRPSQLKFAGEFTGNVGICPVTSSLALTVPEDGMTIAASDSAVLTGTVSIDGYAEYVAAVSGNSVVINCPYAAYIETDGQTTYYETMAAAISGYSGTDAVTLLNDCSDDIAFTQATVLDLNGYDLTGTVTTNGTLTVYDSQTDDYTVEDSYGYGKIPASVSDVAAAEGYLMIQEDDGTSFHRLTVQTIGITLRSSTTGLYYTSEFGGDEIVKANVTSFGVALGANKEPDWADNSFTAFSGEDWIVGADSNGTSLNVENGTILKDIMKTTNAYSINKRNASVSVYGVAYVDLADGTRKTGNMVNYSLRQILEGDTGFNGVDDRWDALTDTQKAEAVTMYKSFEKVMSSWDIPNIKQAYTDSQDDGVLKILIIGHSLGMDSVYFLPEVLKNETGEDVVVGALYHSGCRLNQHVSYLNQNSTEYAYLEYDTSKQTQWNIWYTGDGGEYEQGFGLHYPSHPGGHDNYIGASAAAKGNYNRYGVTMQFGIQQQDWDIIVMQAGVFEAANVDDSSTYSPNITEDIKTIQSYVKNNDANKYTTPKFAWNITWSAPEDKEDLSEGTSYDTLLASEFNDSSVAMYEAIAKTVQEQVLTACEWDYVFQTGTAFQNAKTVMTDSELYRDMIHGKNFVRMMAAYTWYCTMFDVDVSECSFAPIGSAIRFAESVWADGEDYTLTTEEKGIMKDCIHNAIAKPYKITEIQEEDDVLKVLIIGHSTGMDPAYFLPIVAKANGIDMIVGDLYHSGCKLSQHENYLTNGSEEYAYLEYNTQEDTAWRIWETDEGSNGFVTHTPNQGHDTYIGAAAEKAGNANKYGVTMQFGIQRQDWDIVIMMGSRWETAGVNVSGHVLDITDIGVIRDYVLANDIDQTTVPEFAWNTVWSGPEYDEDWLATLSDSHKSSFESSWEICETYFGGERANEYTALVSCLQNTILTNYNFDYLLHNNTVVQKAKALGLGNSDIYRDYIHASDFTRMMIACNWFCGLTETGIEDITIPAIPNALRFKTADRATGEDYTLTDTETANLIACVKNALENPFAVTE